MRSEPTTATRPPLRDHERRDASPGWIFGIVLFLLVSGLIIHGMIAAFLSVLKRGTTSTDAWQPGRHTAINAPALPAFPKLQLSPPMDLQAFHAREEQELESYGWVNRTSGVVRIPIERAMDLVLQQGLPTRTATNENKTGPSSYQLMQQRPDQRDR